MKNDSKNLKVKDWKFWKNSKWNFTVS